MSRKKTAAAPGLRWGIWDVDRECLYVPGRFTESVAHAELAGLLRHFPPDSPWRARLTVRAVAPDERVGSASAGSAGSKRRNRQGGLWRPVHPRPKLPVASGTGARARRQPGNGGTA